MAKARKPQTKKRHNTSSRKNKNTPRKRGSIFRGKLIKMSIIAIVWLLFFLSIFFIYCIYDLPNVENLDSQVQKSYRINIRDSKGRILAIYGNIHGNNITYNQLPKNLINAVIAIEDRKFFDHSGADYFSIIRAFYKNKLAGKTVQGGSTITQQLVKIILLHSKKTIKRKVQELILAYKLENNLFKEQILALYLNNVYMGRGVYGVDAASKYYFNKQIESLSLYESAILAGMLKAPSKYSPFNNIRLSLDRAKVVLHAMREESYISRKRLIQAQPPIIQAIGKRRGVLEEPYFADYVVEQIQEMFGEIKHDIDVYTTLDIHLQRALAKTLKSAFLDSSDRFNISQMAAVTLNATGGIKAMIGGVDYNKSSFNRATNALRQPGSAFKLFVYLSALEKGMKLEDYIDDKPINIRGWSPQNIGKDYQGSITVQDAFAKSVNTASVRIAEKYGRKSVAEIAYRLGVEEKIPNIPSISLGTVEITLLELTKSFAVIANGGYKIIPYTIEKITDNSGKLLYKHPKNNDVKVLSNNVNDKMRLLLKSAVEYGTAKGARINGKVVYGKTGTSQNYRDAWFVGFDENQLTTGIWLGNDDNQQMRKMTGGKLPTTIWKNFYGAISEYSIRRSD